MAAQKALKVKQDDLRRLMQERRQDLKAQKQKIDSPFAKYNSTGQLSCIICNVEIKNSGLWSNHILSKIHKENVQKKKKTSTAPKIESTAPSSKRFLEPLPPPPVKKQKTESNSPVKEVKHARVLSKPPEKEKLQIDPTQEDRVEESPVMSSMNNNINNVLPPDFFDTPQSSTDVSMPPPKALQKEKPKLEQVKTDEVLPEGFFDDPVLDAKARNIEYKDPIEEEWERFKKTIAEETNLSKAIMEEDVEESTVERDIELIDQQIHNWGIVQNLQSKFDETRSKAISKEENEDSSTSSDEEELDNLLDWRAKGVKKK